MYSCACALLCRVDVCSHFDGLSSLPAQRERHLHNSTVSVVAATTKLKHNMLIFTFRLNNGNEILKCLKCVVTRVEMAVKNVSAFSCIMSEISLNKDHPINLDIKEDDK